MGDRRSETISGAIVGLYDAHSRQSPYIWTLAP